MRPFLPLSISRKYAKLFALLLTATLLLTEILSILSHKVVCLFTFSFTLSLSFCKNTSGQLDELETVQKIV